VPVKGRQLRAPAHPDVLVALGRANYTFLSLERTVVAILYDAQFLDLDQSQILTAGRKVDMLRSLAKRYRRSKNGKDVALIIDNAIRAFDDVRDTVRNRLFHAQPFTAGSTTMATTSRAWRIRARTRTQRTSCGPRSPTSRAICSTSRRPSRQRSTRCLRLVRPYRHSRSRD
jgi:hypothetical protein